MPEFLSEILPTIDSDNKAIGTAVLGLACLLLFVVWPLHTGTIKIPAHRKRWESRYTRRESPGMYWGCILLFLAGSLVLFLGVIDYLIQ